MNYPGLSSFGTFHHLENQRKNQIRDFPEWMQTLTDREIEYKMQWCKQNENKCKLINGKKIGMRKFKTSHICSLKADTFVHQYLQ